MDVCFVNMPYAPPIQPSMALGLLQAILERDGFSVASVYANLLFLEAIGIRPYRLVIKTMSSDALRDWTFAHIAFPDFAPDHDEYLDHVIRRNRLPEGCEPDRFKEAVFAVRGAAAEFVDRLATRVLERRPRIVGCTSSFNQHVPSLALLKRIRKLAPDVVTLMGGANCETVMGRTTHKSSPWVDFVVSGEADGLIAPLVRAILQNGREAYGDGLADGVFAPIHRTLGYPRASVSGGDDAPRAVYWSLQSLPVPDFHDYFDTLNDLPAWLRRMILPALPLETSRGCWWGQKRSCTFCGILPQSKRFRSKPAGQVLREIDTLLERYQADRIQTVDNVMNLDFFRSLLPELARRRMPVRLFFDVRPNLSKRQVGLMRDAGLTWVWAGIEHLHERALKLMNKGVTARQNVQLLKWCRQHGIYVGWNLMCDLPGEDDGWYVELARDLPLLSHLQPPAEVTRVRFDRYSDYHFRAKQYGLRLMPARLYAYIYPLSREDLQNQVYFFEDPARARNPLFSPLMRRPGIRAVRRAVDDWTRRFYSAMRPVLSMTVTRSRIRIRDTRPAASQPEFELTGLSRSLYLACDDAPSGENVQRALAERGFAKSEVERAARDLVDRKLLLSSDGHLISLAVREPCAEMPGLSDYPGGGLVSEAARARLDGRDRHTGSGA
ncbi:MAG: RiPP maturation radical SAM C-methyltransferase [Acidobacteriota bacterium]